MRTRMLPSDFALLLVTAAIGLWYVANSLTPSSYAVVLQRIGVPAQENGLLYGHPRPIRSDEWAHMTPWVQATVRNSFSRFNEYSPYREDFRSAYGMPVKDWGLVFKPSYWLFLAAPAKYAYSLHYFLLAAMFILGYAYLFVRLGIPSRTVATAGALILFFSPFIQGWWTVNAVAFSYVPWILLAVLGIERPVWRFLVTTWLLASTSISLFYPPFILIGGLFGAVVFLGYDDSPWQQKCERVLFALFSVLAAGAITYIYLADEIGAILNMVHAEQRRFGSAGMSLRQFITLLYPTLYIHRHDSLIGMNICEIGVIGSIFNIGALIFLDYKRLAQVLASDRRLRRFYGVLLFAFVYVSIWLLLPVPNWLGNIVGLSYVHPNRLGYLGGLFLLVLLLHASYRATCKWSLGRALLFLAALTCPFYAAKVIEFAIPARDVMPDLAGVPVFLLVMLLLTPRLARIRSIAARFLHAARRLRIGVGRDIRAGRHLASAAATASSPVPYQASLVVACAVVATSATFSFNPLQSAEPIFNVPKTAVLTALDDQFARQGGHQLLAPIQWGFPGSVLSGLGYPTENISTLHPVSGYWRSFFPEIAADEFNYIFNRVADVFLDYDVDRPVLAAPGAIAIPLSRLVANFDKDHWRDGIFSAYRSAIFVQVEDAAAKGAMLGGHIDSDLDTADGRLIRGWAPWRGSKPGQRLVIAIPPSAAIPPERHLKLSSAMRPDVAAVMRDQDYLVTGFDLLVKEESVLQLIRMGCLLAEDEPGAYFVLQGSIDGTRNEDTCRNLGWLPKDL